VHLPRSGPSRDRAIYVARAEHGYRFGQIATFLGIDRTTASKAAQRFLDKLDNSESTAG
jgi:DNA-directed RNA polymerase specialized sigma24 family protein